MKYIIIIFLLFIFNNFNICYASYFDLEKTKLQNIDVSGVNKIKVDSAGFDGSFEITQTFYDNLKNNMKHFIDTNYYVYNLSLKEQKIEKVKACNLINFNQNNISKIYLIRAEPIYNKDQTGRIISGKFGFKENYVILNNEKVKFKIRNASGYCQNVKIENCNKDGKSGMECLKLLPDDCEFIISSDYGTHCINLKTDEYELVEFGCDKNGCNRLEFPVEFEDGY